MKREAQETLLRFVDRRTAHDREYRETFPSCPRPACWAKQARARIRYPQKCDSCRLPPLSITAAEDRAVCHYLHPAANRATSIAETPKQLSHRAVADRLRPKLSRARAKSSKQITARYFDINDGSRMGESPIVAAQVSSGDAIAEKRFELVRLTSVYAGFAASRVMRSCLSA